MTEPVVHRVTLLLCAPCLDGAGGECHTPGCVMWLNRAPDLPLRFSPFVESIDGVDNLPLVLEQLNRSMYLTACMAAGDAERGTR